MVSIADFNKLIHEQIKNQPATFIYERLGEKYRHFFIDEFQDTSEMQWNNLIPLIENSLSSMENNIKGTLMIVGDPKQSIYRWRGGKAEQFIALADKTQKGPFPMEDGMNSLLKDVEITLRREELSGRPRINKPGSVKDREQKSKDKYYYS